MRSRTLQSATGRIAGLVIVCLSIVAVLAIASIGSSSSAEAGAAVSSSAPSTALCQQFGVNLSAGEFGSNLPGIYGVDYLYPGIDAEGYDNAWEMDYFHSKGLDMIRLPLQWERLQHDLNGPLSDFDINLIDQVLDNAAAHGMKVVIGPHNFARRTIGGVDYVIGSAQVPYSAFTDFWHRMAQHFAGHPGLYGYALDNEPHDTGGLWVTGGAQAGINGIRMSDTVTPIIVPGDGWSGAWTWLDSGNDALKTLNDPSHNLIFEAHQYFDEDGGGAYTLSYDAQGAYPNLGVDRLTEFVNWLHTNNLKGFLGEYGVPDDDPRWLTMLGNALAYLEANNDVIVGGADWSAGPWWDADYRLSVEPTGTWPAVTDQPQMAVLQAHTGNTAGCGSTPSPTPGGPPTATATPGGCTISFTDVEPGSTFYSYVACLVCRGIVNGYTTGCETGSPCFKPGDNVTRGQLSKIVSISAGFDDDPGDPSFEDVAPGSTFYDYVQRLASRGYIGGYPCGGPGEPCGSDSLPYFRPNAGATRGQLAKIVSNAAGLNSLPTDQSFEDVEPGSTFYDYVERLHMIGAIGGYDCGGPGEPCGTGNLPYFRPTNSVTRGQTTKIVTSTFYPVCVSIH